jgi:carbonic anhydrase
MYRYSGSLRTPPYTEGVRWVVFPQPIEAIRSRMGHQVDHDEGQHRFRRIRPERL